MISCKSNRGEYEILGYIEKTDHKQITTYFEQSKEAFTVWSQLSVKERISYIQGFLEEYTIIGNNIALSISKEIGKPISQSLADISYDIGYIQWHLDNAERILSPEIIHQTDLELHTAHHEPKGVATVISPRNYPSSQFIRQVIPPLLAGNTILYKSASACMWTGKLISDLIMKHLPEGVFIPMYGDSSLGQALIDLPTDLTIFTGSTGVGKIISSTNGIHMKTSHLELGGSAPGIVCEDASIDNQMMQTIEYFRVRHGGQICDGLKRLIVHESRLDELVDNLKHYFGNLQMGNPLDEGTGLGPVISESAYITIQKQINSSLRRDGNKKSSDKAIQVIELGNYDGTPGAYVPLTLLIDRYHDELEIGNNSTQKSSFLSSPVMVEEVFGPVLPIVTFKTIEEAIAIANDTIYGLGGYLWGNNEKEIDYICDKLHTGNINVNNTNYVIPQVPFGGYTPSSGNFREHGWIGLREYCELKVVSKKKLTL